VRLRLATRGSALAWTQSGLVADALRAQGHDVELVRVTTHGDVSNAPLASLGGAGVFVGAVRAAVLAGDADLAVHSFKDLPTAPPDGLALAAVPPREDPADALCARDGLCLDTLPHGARVGTGSPRRAAQVLARRPDLEVVAIRGNVETRLARITDDLDAVVLAAAGLRRLGLAAAITDLLDPDRFLPAPAQGALAVECRADAPSELRAALAALDDPASRRAALAERAVLARLEAGCAAPVAAHAVADGGRMVLVAAVTSTDGAHELREAAEGVASDEGAVGLGTRVADLLLAAGAAELVELAAGRPKPLAGRRVLVPERAPAGCAEALAAAGADVVRAAFTGFEALAPDRLGTALAAHWDWLVVTSARTVASLPAARVAAGTGRVAAVGPATADALRAAGLEPDLVADPGGGAALVDAFPDGPGRVVMPGAESPSGQPADGLVAKGWTVEAVPVYRTVDRPLPDDVVSTWRSGGFDLFVVTAGSVARAGVAAAGLPGPEVVALGASAADAARAAGLRVAAVAARPDAAALLAAASTAAGVAATA
jgi:hydroxymethylbilane synthase